MESFVHLRKGKTPPCLHADLDGLKDDELGRGGFTGRAANMYRRHDPAYRLFKAIGHPDKEMYEITCATNYYAGPKQRDKLRRAVDIVTDLLVRHDFASRE
jgi:homogentisate 1,2-dioxygenase